MSIDLNLYSFCYFLLLSANQGGGGGGEEEGSQRVQTSSPGTGKFHGCHVQHDDCRQHCCPVQVQVVKRGNPKCSHHKENPVSAFSFRCIYLRWRMLTKLTGVIILQYM